MATFRIVELVPITEDRVIACRMCDWMTVESLTQQNLVRNGVGALKRHVARDHGDSYREPLVRRERARETVEA